MLLKQFMGMMMGLKENPNGANQTASNRKGIDGTTGTMNIFGSYGTSVEDLYVALGSGNTPPAFDDYALETPLSLTRLSLHYVWGNYSTDNTLLELSTVYKNETGAAVTVKELGIYKYCQYDNPNTYCIARSVLDTPITIGAGETYTFSYCIEI